MRIDWDRYYEEMEEVLSSHEQCAMTLICGTIKTVKLVIDGFRSERSRKEGFNKTD